MKRLIPLALIALSLFACKKAENVVPTPADQLVERMTALRQQGIMYGHQDDPFYGITWQWEEDRSDTYELVGDYPAVMGFDLGGLEEHHDKNLDSVPFCWIRKEAIRHIQRGGIVTFSWHPRNPRTGSTAWDTSDSTVVRNILPGGEQYELFQSWMNDVATFLETIVDEEGNPLPFIFRPWHENNGSWFWWGQKLCSDEEYQQMWHMFADYMNKRMPGNIVWSYSPNLQGGWTDEEMLRRWPGEPVRLLGLDTYQWGSEEDFVNGTKDDALYLSDFAMRHNVLFAITECGIANSPVPDWWTRVFMPAVEEAHPCYFLPWRNWHAEHFGASPDATTADDFRRLYLAPNTLFLQDINQ